MEGHNNTLGVQIWTSYVKAFESYRLIDIQTYMTEIIYRSASQVVNDRNLANSLIWSFRHHMTEVRQSTTATSEDW